MKKVLAVLSGVLVAVAVFAGPDVWRMQFTTIATNGATSGIVTNSKALHGYYIDAISIDLAGTSTNVDIDVVTQVGKGTGPSRTILSTNDMTADAVVYPRVFGLHTTSGANRTAVEGIRIPLVLDTVQCWMQAETTGVTANVYIILSTEP